MPIKFTPGCKPSVHDNRVLRLANYIGAPFLTHPPKWNWTDNVKVAWPMMLNDKEGDCVCASAGHMVMSWSAANGNLFVPSDDDIQKAYSDNSGYDPATGENDNGCTLSGVLKYWQNTGIGGHKIGAYVQVDEKNFNHICAALYNFGGVFSAIEVDQFMEDEFNAGKPWTVPIDPTTWTPLGGHGVPLLAFQPKQFNLITWAKDQPMSYNCWWMVGMETWCAISEDFISGNKPAPNGFNMDQLVADLSAVKE